MDYNVADIKRASEGAKRIDWADRDMPVLAQIRERFSKTKPFRGVKVSACLHVTPVTANLLRTFRAGGAEVMLCASNPLSTQDDVAAALVKNCGVAVFARHGADQKTYAKHLAAVAARLPDLIVDDGGELTRAIIDRHSDAKGQVIAALEGTASGAVRLRALERDGRLLFPAVSVNDAAGAHLFDNRYGTGQSTLDGIIRATNVLVAGQTFVVAGYGWCGKGLAMRVRGLGGRVVVTEVDEIRALEAVMDGFEVIPMADAARLGDLFCTVTGDRHVIRPEHVKVMKDGAVICNAGHLDVEIDLDGIKKMAKKAVRQVRGVDMTEYVINASKSVYVLAEGRLVNMGCGEGRPASVMDMTYALESLTAEWCMRMRGKLEAAVYAVPQSIDSMVASLKLKALGVRIDTLTPAQKKYLTGADR